MNIKGGISVIGSRNIIKIGSGPGATVQSTKLDGGMKIRGNDNVLWIGDRTNSGAPTVALPMPAGFGLGGPPGGPGRPGGPGGPFFGGGPRAPPGGPPFFGAGPGGPGGPAKDPCDSEWEWVPDEPAAVPTLDDAENTRRKRSRKGPP